MAGLTSHALTNRSVSSLKSKTPNPAPFKRSRCFQGSQEGPPGPLGPPSAAGFLDAGPPGPGGGVSFSRFGCFPASDRDLQPLRALRWASRALQGPGPWAAAGASLGGGVPGLAAAGFLDPVPLNKLPGTFPGARSLLTQKGLSTGPPSLQGPPDVSPPRLPRAFKGFRV